MTEKKGNNLSSKSNIHLTNEDDELDKFIVDNFNNEIYQDLIGVWKPFLFLTTPLEFFRELYSDFDWIQENKHRPRAITEYFKNKHLYLRIYFLQKLEELLDRKLSGENKTIVERLSDTTNNYSQSREYKQIEEAKENIRKIRRSEEKDFNIRYIQHNFVDEISEKMESLPETEKEHYFRSKADEFFRIPQEDIRTYELHKNFNLTEWFRENLEPYNVEKKQSSKFGRPKGKSSKIPAELQEKVLIDAYNKLMQSDEIPTATNLATELKVSVPTIRNYLRNTGLNTLEQLKLKAEKKKT